MKQAEVVLIAESDRKVGNRVISSGASKGGGGGGEPGGLCLPLFVFLVLFYKSEVY